MTLIVVAVFAYAPVGGPPIFTTHVDVSAPGATDEELRHFHRFIFVGQVTGEASGRLLNPENEAELQFPVTVLEEFVGALPAEEVVVNQMGGERFLGLVKVAVEDAPPLVPGNTYLFAGRPSRHRIDNRLVVNITPKWGDRPVSWPEDRAAIARRFGTTPHVDPSR